jgi:hypothetical protein
VSSQHELSAISHQLSALRFRRSVTTTRTAAVDRHDRALHINQIILAQLLSFQSKIVPY